MLHVRKVSIKQYSGVPRSEQRRKVEIWNDFNANITPGIGPPVSHSDHLFAGFDPGGCDTASALSHDIVRKTYQCPSEQDLKRRLVSLEQTL